MRNTTRWLSILIVGAGLVAGTANATSEPAALGFTMNRIDGTPEALDRYHGQVVMLVNVASRCGFTPQYDGLEQLYERYRDRGFVVLGFPSNDFAGQEPGTNAEIAEFCRATWSVKFPMFEKIHVRGAQQHPLYTYLTTQTQTAVRGEIEWNFQKFLIDRHGQVVERITPRTDPLSATVVERIETLLAEPHPG